MDALWGGFTREHGDLDGFTEDLHEHVDELTAAWTQLGYTVNYLHDFWMLQVIKGGVHGGFNSLRNIDGIAHWHHIGPHGTVFFPWQWLDREPRMLHGAPARTAGLRFCYAIKTHSELLNPLWHTREKDKADIGRLRELMAKEGLDEEQALGQIWSHNPFWYARGYPESLLPMFPKR